MKASIIAGAVAAALLGAQQPGLPVFTDITKDAGITFKHSYGDHHMDNIVEGTGAGACVFDYNNDGFLDVYFITGTWTKGVSDNEGRDLRGKLSNRLYKNNGNGTYTDVTEQTGTGGKGIFSSGCAAADFDNDGDVDLHVLNYGPDLLYRNSGDGTFSEVAEQAGLADKRWGLSAVWFDYNGDGWLDVYVCNYLKYDDGKFRDFYPAAGYPGPLSYNGEPDALYRNNGNGTFTDVTKETGLYKEDGRGMSVTAADLNNDGRLDVYVTNDAMENDHFEATADGKFVERAVEAGTAFGENGQNVASMGPWAGDINRDGMLDIFIPDLNYNSMLVQVKPGLWQHRSAQLGISQIMGQYAGWAGLLIDYDNDGWLDIFVTHGNAHHEYVQEDTLLHNKGNGTFEDVSRQSGKYFFEKYVGRGAAWGDFDNDGDLDLLVININDSPKLLRNDGGNKNNWLNVEASLKFPTGSRTALGARVTVTTGDLKQVEDVIPVRGYLSQGDHRLMFGLGKNATADVEIRWPDGRVDKLEKVKANQFLKVAHEAKAAGANIQ
ncbi:MAG TPA: CRTAC1 family protein [Bryobacteraceae bacterium]|nr:CRTAC1 family protein [Bryobacteraceae bacterium]